MKLRSESHRELLDWRELGRPTWMKDLNPEKSAKFSGMSMYMSSRECEQLPMIELT